MTYGVFNSAAFRTASGLAIAPLASVEVRREDTNALATLYADAAGAVPLSNPFAADAQGRFSLYAAGIALGYKVTVTSGLEVAILRNVPIGTAMYLDAAAAAVTSVAGRTGAVVLTSADVGLTNANNTSDANKPVSTAQAAADTAAYAAAVATSAGAIALKADFASPTFTGNPTAPTASPGDSDTSLATTAFVAAAIAAAAAVVPKSIWGLTYQNNVADAANDLDIAAGGCVDDAGTYLMVCAALTKQSDAAWAVGNAAGMLDTGAVGNNDYYLWAIARSGTGVKDYLCSLSSTAPTMPASYDKKRLIGWFKRVAGSIVAFKTYEGEGGGLAFLWTTPTLDINLANTLTTARRTDTIKVPQNFSVIAQINAIAYDAATPAFTCQVCCPDEADVVPSGGAAPLANLNGMVATNQTASQLYVRTSATGTIAARATLATVDSYLVSTKGFTWARRN